MVSTQRALLRVNEMRCGSQGGQLRPGFLGGILEDFLEGARYEQGHGERREDMEDKWKTRNE